MRRNCSRNTYLRLSVGYVPVEPTYITTVSKSTNLMKKQGVRDKVKCTAKTKINDVRFKPRAD
jgi:hypothetical protein